MSTYYALHVHVVFSTKHRRPWLAGEWRGSLHAYLGGCLKSLEAVPEAIGGTADHVHLLIGLRAKHSPSDIVREIKKASNGFVRDEMGVRDFAWQEGYAVISVSPRDKAMIVNYIANQEAHHRTVDPVAELRQLLEEAGIAFDIQYLE